MDFLPFEIYSAPFPRDKYGWLWEIPNYLSDEEFWRISDSLLKHQPIPSDIYPNKSYHVDHTNKSLSILRYAREIFDYHLDNNEHAASYRFVQALESRKFMLNERVQGSPRGMREYPPHTDGGKLLTCLIPLSPVKSVPTSFFGLDSKQEVVSIPWKVNHAYLFCSSSQYSWHGYVGDREHDRWVLNVNLHPVEERNHIRVNS